MPTVTVSVSSPGVINVSPDPVPVSGANQTITYNLAASGYSFRSSNAIVVPQPASQFPNASVTVSATQVTLLDVNSDSNQYKYVIHLVKDSDGSPLDLDPMIQNGQ